MKISIVFNEVCSFTGNEEEAVINLLNERGESINLSRECLELGLKMLSVVDGKSQVVPTPPTLPIVMPGQPNWNPPIVTCGQTPPIQGDSHRAFNQRRQSPQPFDMNKAKIFLNELQSQQKQFLSENENKKDDGGISDVAIRNSVKQLSGEINKETMFKVLNKLLKFNKERFDLLYEQSHKNYEATFKDE